MVLGRTIGSWRRLVLLLLPLALIGASLCFFVTPALASGCEHSGGCDTPPEAAGVSCCVQQAAPVQAPTLDVPLAMQPAISLQIVTARSAVDVISLAVPSGIPPAPIPLRL